jgi:hypothetical protein
MELVAEDGFEPPTHGLWFLVSGLRNVKSYSFRGAKANKIKYFSTSRHHYETPNISRPGINPVSTGPE